MARIRTVYAAAIPLHDVHATWLIFLHAAEDKPTNYLHEFAGAAVDGNELGDHVSDYTWNTLTARATLEAAHNRLHQHGIYHKHTPLHQQSGAS